MDTQDVRASIDERSNVAIGMLDHEMGIKRRCRDAGHGLHERRAEGDVVDEMSVHHVEMEKLDAVLFHRGDFVRQMGEITCEQTRGHGCARFARVSLSVN